MERLLIDKDAENTIRSTRVAKELFHEHFRGKKPGPERQERFRSFEIFHYGGRNIEDITRRYLSLFSLKQCITKQL